MKNKKILIIGLIVFVLAIAGGFKLYSNNFYKTHFKPNTEIYSIDVSKLTVDEAYSKLNDNNVLNINLENDNGVVTIPLTDVSNFSKGVLYKYLHTDTLSVYVDSESLTNKINELNLNNEAIDSTDAYITKNEDNSFVIVPEVYGNTINTEELITAINDSVQTGNLTFNLNDYHSEPSIKSDNTDLQNKLNQLVSQENSVVSIKIKDNIISIPANIIKDSVTADGINQDVLINWLNSIEGDYVTSNSNMTFTTHTGEQRIMLNNSSYSWVVDSAATAANISPLIEAGDTSNQSIEITPLGKGYDETSQFGGNYVEVDLNEQKAYIYSGGNIIFTWDFISGLPNSLNHTELGIQEVLYKQSPSVLKGTNNDGSSYATPVSYWIPFNTSGEGFHDATWQTQGFGGNKYLTLGSHGCINTSLTDMQTVWELTYTGQPVIVWGDIYNGL